MTGAVRHDKKMLWQTPMDRAKRLCRTSVDDARSSLAHVNDLNALDYALQYAIQHDGRKSLIAAIRARIRKVEKEKC